MREMGRENTSNLQLSIDCSSTRPWRGRASWRVGWTTGGEAASFSRLTGVHDQHTEARATTDYLDDLTEIITTERVDERKRKP
jgi:hypothetical protein